MRALAPVTNQGHPGTPSNAVHQAEQTILTPHAERSPQALAGRAASSPVGCSEVDALGERYYISPVPSSSSDTLEPQPKAWIIVTPGVSEGVSQMLPR